MSGPMISTVQNILPPQLSTFVTTATVGAAVGVTAVMGLSHYLSYRPSKVSLRNAHVLVTGGSSGIGLAVATLCLHQGAGHVTILGSSPSKLEGAVATLKAARPNESQRVSGIAHDVSKPTVVEALKAHTKVHGAVDVLVASAGVTNVQMFEDIPLETFDRLMRVNYLGCVYSVRGVMEEMKRNKRGRIIFVSSMAGQAGMVGYGSYSPSKFAVRGLAEALCMELCPYGIGVSVCNPPNVDTPMYEEEMKTKPLPTKLCDEGSGLFSAEDIAHDIVNKGIKKYSFFIQSGFDGVMLGIGSIGMAPASSAMQVITETLALGVLRFVGLFYLKSFYNICRKCAAGPNERTPLQ